MNKLLGATIALVISAGVYKVSAQQADMPAGNNGPMGQQSSSDHRGPPPNVQQAIALLDQARQQSTGATASLIDQAEDLLKRPPPRHGGMGGQGGQGQMQGPPLEQQQ